MNRKLIALVVVVVVAVAGVGGYVLLSGGLPGGGQSLISLESVSVVGDSEVKATWRVHNPSDSNVGLTALTVLVRGGSVPMQVKRGSVTCTDIGPGQTVSVDQNYDVFKIVEEGGVQRSDPYPKAELDAITDWRSEGGLASFISGGCGTGGESLCAEIEGRTTNSCGSLPRL